MSSEKETSLKNIFKAQTFGEVIDNISYGVIENIAVMPAYLFFTVYLCGYKRNFINDGILDLSIPQIYHLVFRDTCLPALILGLVSMVLFIAKKRHDGQGKSIWRFFADNAYIAIFAVYYLLVLASTFANGFTKYVIEGYEYRGESLYTMFCYVLAFMLPMTIIRSEARRKGIIYTYMVFGIIMGISMLIKTYYYGLFPHNFAGIFSHFNHYSYFLTMFISISGVLMLTEKNIPLKILSAVSFVFNIVLLVINDTFGGQLSTIAALILVPIMISLHRGKFTPWAFIPLVLYAIIMPITVVAIDGNKDNFAQLGGDIANIATGNTTGEEGTHRLKLWLFAIDRIKEKPLLGHGLEGITDAMGANGNFDNNRPHNEYLQYAAFFGIPAAAAYFAGCFATFLRGLKFKGQLDGAQIAGFAASFAYLVSALFGNTMYYTTPLFFMFMGLSCSVHASEDKEAAEKAPAAATADK